MSDIEKDNSYVLLNVERKNYMNNYNTKKIKAYYKRVYEKYFSMFPFSMLPIYTRQLSDIITLEYEPKTNTTFIPPNIATDILNGKYALEEVEIY